MTEVREPERATPPHTELSVVLTGAFLTGFALQAPLDEHQARRRAIESRLQGAPNSEWETLEDNDGSGTYASGGGFTETLPFLMCRRSGPAFTESANAVLDELATTDRDWVEWHESGGSIRLVQLEVNVYDFGIAVVSATLIFSMTAERFELLTSNDVKKLTWLRPNSDTAGLPAISGLISQVASDTVVQLEAANSEPQVSSGRRRSTISSPLEVVPMFGTTAGRLMWLHPVLLIECAEPSDIQPLSERFAADFHSPLAVTRGRFVPGVGSSAIVMSQGARSSAILQLIDRHWAIFAHYMHTDRKLLHVLDGLRWSAPQTLQSLEHEAQTIFDERADVLQIRARIDSELASLGGDEQAIWDKIALVQGFEALVEGVDRKVDLLQSIAERRVQEATIGSNRRTTRILSSLTALTIVTVTVGILGALLGSRAANYDDILLRMTAIVAAGLLACIVLVIAFRYRPRAHRRDSASGLRRTR